MGEYIHKMRPQHEVEAELKIKREALDKVGDHIPLSHYSRLEAQIQSLEWVLRISRYE